MNETTTPLSPNPTDAKNGAPTSRSRRDVLLRVRGGEREAGSRLSPGSPSPKQRERGSGGEDNSPDSTHSLLSADAVSLRLGERDVLRDVNLALNPGEVVGLIGPNGAGK